MNYPKKTHAPHFVSHKNSGHPTNMAHYVYRSAIKWVTILSLANVHVSFIEIHWFSEGSFARSLSHTHTHTTYKWPMHFTSKWKSKRSKKKIRKDKSTWVYVISLVYICSDCSSMFPLLCVDCIVTIVTVYFPLNRAHPWPLEFSIIKLNVS